MTQSIYWYDFETTGTDPARDRAIQFAGVRTDLDLNLIEEPLNLFCYPGDDVIPVPEAMLVTGLKMSWLREHGLSETQFIDKIHAAFAVPGTCVAGYNSIRFDDEFTRHILYRNFLDPYAREWQRDNSRWDVIDVMRMAQALRPAGLSWPRNEEGAPVFRLEALTRTNGVVHEEAHDAVSDILATVMLTAKLRGAQRKLYDYLFDLRLKKNVLRQLYPLGKSAILHVSSMYAAANNCIAIVLPLCVHPTNSNGVICYDLSHDPSELIEMGPEALHRRLFTATIDLAPDEARVPLKTIHVNRSPAVAPLSTLRPADADRLGLDVGMCEVNMKAIQHASGMVEKIQDAFAQAEYPLKEDPDLMLYQGGFFSGQDKSQMAEMRSMGSDGLASARMQFDDARIPDMLFRYRARNFPDSLSPEDQAAWNQYRVQKWEGGAQITQTLDRIDVLLTEGKDAACLVDLKRHVEGLWQSVASRD